MEQGHQNWSHVPGGRHYHGGLTVLGGPLRVEGAPTTVQVDIDGQEATVRVLDGLGEVLPGVAAFTWYLADSETAEHPAAASRAEAMAGTLLEAAPGLFGIAVTNESGALRMKVTATVPLHLVVLAPSGLVISEPIAPAAKTAKANLKSDTPKPAAKTAKANLTKANLKSDTPKPELEADQPAPETIAPPKRTRTRKAK